jgi:hypothetical protein
MVGLPLFASILIYELYECPYPHRRLIRTTNGLERISREVQGHLINLQKQTFIIRTTSLYLNFHTTVMKFIYITTDFQNRPV